MKKRNTAFTLIEIMIVIAIILVMTTVGIDIYSSSRKFLAVDLESDKLVSVLQSLRGESKVSGAKCVGVKFELNQTLKRIIANFNNTTRRCETNERDETPIPWGAETSVSNIMLGNSSVDNTPLTVFFMPPFGEMLFEITPSRDGNELTIKISFAANSDVYKKISLNRVTGKIEKI